MTPRRRFRGFTLVEVVVVLAVIIVLVGLTASVAAYVIRKGSRESALGQIQKLEAACASYRTDHGTFPQNTETDALEPRKHFNPTMPEYLAASRHLYAALSNRGVGKGYHEFTRRELSKPTNGAAAPQVTHVIDPFGYCLGYSTAGAVAEEAYRVQVRANPAAGRPNPPKGYNHTFDLWSTGGATTEGGTTKWIKNWGGH